jgi:hypothetical protein
VYLSVRFLRLVEEEVEEEVVVVLTLILLLMLQGGAYRVTQCALYRCGAVADWHRETWKRCR